jgi:hypothetical protein
MFDYSLVTRYIPAWRKRAFIFPALQQNLWVLLISSLSPRELTGVGNNVGWVRATARKPPNRQAQLVSSNLEYIMSRHPCRGLGWVSLRLTHPTSNLALTMMLNTYPSQLPEREGRVLVGHNGIPDPPHPYPTHRYQGSRKSTAKNAAPTATGKYSPCQLITAY